MRIIDNPMATGYGWPDEKPLRYKKPDHYDCPRCGVDMKLSSQVFEWGEDWICGECLVDAVHSLSREDRAEMAGEEICYTEQQLEAYHGSAGAYASIFGITTERVSEIA